jgi:hypothetical protein
MQQLLIEMGLNQKEIKQVNAAHKMAVKINNTEKRVGGGKFKDNGLIGSKLQKLQKFFHFDKATMQQIEKAHRMANKITRKQTNGGAKRTSKKSYRSERASNKSERASDKSERASDKHEGASDKPERASDKPERASETSFVKGSFIDGNYQKEGKWFPGKISHVNSDGTYDIEYKDGKTEKHINKNMIRVSAVHVEDSNMITTAGMITIYASNYFLSLGMGAALPIISICWGIIGKALDKYANGKPLEETDLTKISTLMYYILPASTIVYLYFDSIQLSKIMQVQLEIDKQKILLQNLQFPDVDLNSTLTGQNLNSLAPYLQNPTTGIGVLKVLLLNLFQLASFATAGTFNNIVKPVASSAYTVTSFGLANRPIITVAMIAWIGKYLYTRFSNDKEKNNEFAQTVYNTKRRILIMEYQLKKAKQQEIERNKQQEEYEKKVEEQLIEDLRDKSNDKPKIEPKSPEEEKKISMWHKFVKTGMDDDKLYHQNQIADKEKAAAKTAKEDKASDKASDKEKSNRSKSRTSTPARRNLVIDEVVLDNLDKIMAENKIK